MKNINELGKDLSKFQKKLEINLMKAQEETAKKIKEDVIKNLGHSKGKYVESIKQGETKKEESSIKTEIYTDLLSEEDPKGNKYAIGRMIENGTGIYALEPHVGHTDTFKNSGYQYWYVPTGKVERPLGKTITINENEYYVVKAQKPKPHWKPALDMNIETYKSNIKKAVKESL